MSGEIWKPVRGHEGAYEVSDHGRVRSLPRILVDSKGRRREVGGRLLKLQARDPRYHSVTISGRSVRVHELVAAAFIGPRPDGQHVLHGDDVGTHNHISNLRYGTVSDNRGDVCLNAAKANRFARRDGRLRPSDVAAIKALLPDMGSRALARAWGVSKGAIEGIRRGRNWRVIQPVNVAGAQDDRDILRHELTFGPLPLDAPIRNARRELDRRRAAP